MNDDKPKLWRSPKYKAEPQPHEMGVTYWRVRLPNGDLHPMLFASEEEAIGAAAMHDYYFNGQGTHVIGDPLRSASRAVAAALEHAARSARSIAEDFEHEAAAHRKRGE